MADYGIHYYYSIPESLHTREYGTRLQIVVGDTIAQVIAGYESSSSTVTFPSSSSASGQDYDIFLYKTDSDNVTHFLGICSPLDLVTWPQNTPDPATGLFRMNSGDWVFRNELTMDDFISEIQNDIQSLADALAVLFTMEAEEVLTYGDSSLVGTELSSSSSEYVTGGPQITITRAAVVPYPSGAPVGHRLQVIATGVGMDPKIFLHRNDLTNRDGEILSRPIAVCSPGDMVDYPADEPISSQWPRHYRTADFDIVTKDIELLDEVWTNIKLEVDMLVAAMVIHSTEITEQASDNITD